MGTRATAAPAIVLFFVAACGGATVRHAVAREIVEQGHTLDRRDLSSLGSDSIQWPKPVEIEAFVPLGFSIDGWFAYSSGLGSLALDEPLGTCTVDTQCFDVSLLNVLCDTPCAGDIDSDKGPQCECIHGIGLRDLEARRIAPVKDLRFDEFPLRRDGRVYDIELHYREKAANSEVLARSRHAGTPETTVYLVEEQGTRTALATIDHNHSGIGVGVRVAGWLKHPHVDRYVILLLCRRMTQGDKPYFLLPVTAKLR